MRRIALCSLVSWWLSVEPERRGRPRSPSTVARGTSADVIVSIDGAPVDDLARRAVVRRRPGARDRDPRPDGSRLRIGGNLEGATTVPVSSHGQTLVHRSARQAPGTRAAVDRAIATRREGRRQRGSPRPRARHPVPRTATSPTPSGWTVRNTNLASLDMAGMKLARRDEGHDHAPRILGAVATVAAHD